MILEEGVTVECSECGETIEIRPIMKTLYCLSALGCGEETPIAYFCSPICMKRSFYSMSVYDIVGMEEVDKKVQWHSEEEKMKEK